MNHFQPLTDIQWQSVEHLFPKPEKRSRGKPHTPWRSVLNSVLFVLMTGVKWEALPKLPEFASKSAAHRWYKVWKVSGKLDAILEELQKLRATTALIFPRTRNRLPKPVAAEMHTFAEIA